MACRQTGSPAHHPAVGSSNPAGLAQPAEHTRCPYSKGKVSVSKENRPALPGSVVLHLSVSPAYYEGWQVWWYLLPPS